MERKKRRARPSMEGLEGRALLNGSKGHAALVKAAPSSRTRLNYTTPDGAKVRVQLTGPGNLIGSNAPGGVLNLVFSGTTAATAVVGTVRGGAGVASLGSVRNANVPLDSTTGLGGEVVGAVRLPGFNLAPGGVVNLLGGVNELTLNSVAANTQVRLRDTPLISTDDSDDAGDGPQDPLDPITTAFGGGFVSGTTGANPSALQTVGNGQNFPGPAGLSQSQVSSGRDLSYSVSNLGGTQLTGIAGTFMPGPNLIEPRDVSLPGDRVPPPGVIVNIRRIAGGTPAGVAPLGNPQVYGYDPAADALIRFDAATGAPLQSIPVPASDSGLGGVTLARAGGRLVALVGIGPNVLAYDASTGAPAGGFTTAGLASRGFTAVTGLATGGGVTVAVDSTAGATGTAQAIDVTRSLATGRAVAVGSAFSPGSAFVLNGGIAGVPGYTSLFAAGGARFDTFQPDVNQEGILAISPAGGRLAEASRDALRSQGSFIRAEADGSISGNASRAVGSVESFLAVDTGVRNGVNTIALFTPLDLTPSGTITLANANPLADLSESFHPEIANAALIDVQGNIQSFTARDARGLVLNDAGNAELISIRRARDTSIVALPLSHLDIPIRQNVSIVSSSRLIGDRGDVTVNTAAVQVGPLSLP